MKITGEKCLAKIKTVETNQYESLVKCEAEKKQSASATDRI